MRSWTAKPADRAALGYRELPEVQVFSVSSAGVTFAMVADVPALRLVAWRLQITTALCSPACVWQFLRLPAGKRHFSYFPCLCSLSLLL